MSGSSVSSAIDVVYMRARILGPDKRRAAGLRRARPAVRLRAGMDPRRDVLETAVARGDAPFVVGMVADGDGVVLSGAAGEAAPGVPAGPDTLFRVFSMTKAVAAVAAMILVERGQLDLDAPVTRYLPEFGRIEVLDGWDGETPRLRAPRAPRHGPAARDPYVRPRLHPLERRDEALPRRVRAARAWPRARGRRCSTRWRAIRGRPGATASGVDWLGLVVEAASGRPIDAFCAEEIFAPLGMTLDGVRPRRPPAGAARAGLVARGGRRLRAPGHRAAARDRVPGHGRRALLDAAPTTCASCGFSSAAAPWMAPGCCRRPRWRRCSRTRSARSGSRRCSRPPPGSAPT